MSALTYSATMLGLKAIKIEVEVDATQGMPRLVLIGLPTKAVCESKERITSALRNCGIRIKSQRTIVNLAPADLRKSSPTFELAIAVALLKLYGHLTHNTDQTIFFGQLSLTGQLKAITGALPLVMAAKDLGFKRVVLPAANAAEVSLVSDLIIHPVTSLNQYLTHQQQNKPLPILHPAKELTLIKQSAPQTSFDAVCGHQVAKRALTIAVAGQHNLLMVGPPGAGKSMLAQATTSILPPLTKQEAMAVTSIHSLYGNRHQQQLITTQPFRSPHHSTTHLGLIGGGSHLKPGEITLAHHGILFLDELSEFRREALEALRQPLENKVITLNRAQRTATYPADFILLAATNPCPCGFYGSEHHECSCTSYDLKKYRHKLSGPILDRFGLVVPIKSVTKQKLVQSQKAHSLNKIRAKIKATRDMLAQTTEADLAPKAEKLLLSASKKFHLTTRGFFKIKSVAQTIAGLDQRTKIKKADVAEALQYRPQFNHHSQQ